MYAVNVFRFQNRTKYIAEVVVKLQYVLLVLIFVGTMLIWSTSWFDSQEVSKILVQATNGIFIIAHAGFILSGCTLFTKYIEDLKVITINATKVLYLLLGQLRKLTEELSLLNKIC